MKFYFLSRSIARRIIAIYVLFGLLWILGSDYVVNHVVQDSQTLTLLQTFKGWGFVAITSLLLYRLLRQVERSLQESEDLLTILMESTPDPIFVKDAQGRYVVANSITSDILNYPVSEILGEQDTKFFTPEIARVLMDTDRAVMQSGQTQVLEEVVPTAGEHRIYLSTKTPWRDRQGQVIGTVGVARDITERKRVEEALQRQNELMQTILDHIPVMIARFDTTHQFQWVNREWERVLGWSLAEVQQQDVLVELYPDAQYRQYVIDYIQAAGRVWSDFKMRLRDGRLLDASWANVRLSDGTSIGIGQDVSIRKQREEALKVSEQRYRQLSETLEERVRQRTTELQQRQEALEQEIQERQQAERRLLELAVELRRSNRDLEQFAYVASHDLQEPLRAIEGYTKLLFENYSYQFDETARIHMNFVVDGTLRMRQLIQDLLAYSRVRTRGEAFAPIDCEQVLGEVLSNLQVQIHESRALITHDPLPMVSADHLQMVQLLQNLISNAIKFCREVPRIHLSAVHHRVYPVPVVVEWVGEFDFAASLPAENANAPLWLFSIQDNGIGMETKHLERIFVIFKRLHTRRQFEGTGIGLAICKRIVERHGGVIWAESAVGVGSTFYFTLPDRTPDPD